MVVAWIFIIMDIRFERRIKVNEWIIKARWFYMLGIFMIGMVTKAIGVSNIEFSVFSMALILFVFACVNLSFYLFLKRIKKTRIPAHLYILGSVQIAIELLTFTLVMHKAGGIESISSIFYFLTIVSASLMFGARGSIITAIFSSLLINFLVIFEYYNIIPHISRYGTETIAFNSLPIALTSTITTSVFYVIVGLFAGYGSKLLYDRELLLFRKTEVLDKETKLRRLQLKKLDRTAKLLIGRDLELNKTNIELDNKIKELKGSRKALMNMLEDAEKARQETEEEKEKTLAIISNLTDPIIFIDSNNKISLLNLSAQKVLGLNKSTLGKEVSNKNDFSINNFKNMINVKYKVKELKKISKKDRIIEEISLKFQNQERIYRIMTAEVCNDKGQCYGFIKIFYDLTREKTLDKIKSEFISIAAHQLRTPLSAIKWIIKMILDKDVGELTLEQEELLKKGYKSNERIIKLVDDLLNVSRIEEGKFGFTFDNHDFKEIINIAIVNLERTIAKNHFKIIINSPDKIPEIYVDKERMIIVVQNLLDNATKYTPEYGTIKINVEKGTKLLKVTIKDNGVGIPKKDQAKLFSKFFRAANVMRMQTEGTGLGLFIVKNIIEKHGGKIAIKSEEGKGTEVSFSLPLKK